MKPSTTICLSLALCSMLLSFGLASAQDSKGSRKIEKVTRDETIQVTKLPSVSNTSEGKAVKRTRKPILDSKAEKREGVSTKSSVKEKRNETSIRFQKKSSEATLLEKVGDTKDVKGRRSSNRK